MHWPFSSRPAALLPARSTCAQAEIIGAGEFPNGLARPSSALTQRWRCGFCRASPVARLRRSAEPIRPTV